MQEIGDMVVTVVVDGDNVTRNLKEDLEIDETYIGNALFKSSGITAYWHMLFEKQKTIVQKTKVALDRLRAGIGYKIRKEAKSDGERVTDKAVDEQIIIDNTYQDLEERLLEAQETLNILKGAVEAIR